MKPSITLDSNEFADMLLHAYQLGVSAEKQTPVQKEILMKVSELAGTLTAIGAQVTKAKEEVIAKIKELEDALANHDDDLPVEVTDALNALKAAVQAVDDLHPDTVNPEAGQ